MWSGTVKPRIFSARPALAGEYKGCRPSDREAIVEGILERGPSGFANKGLEELCLGTEYAQVGVQCWLKHTSSHTLALTVHLLPAIAQGPELEDRCWD